MPQEILVLPSEYPSPDDPFDFGGCWVEDQARAVAARGLKVSVIQPLLVRSSQPLGSVRHLSHGVPRFVVPYRHLPKSWLVPYVLAARRGLYAAGLARHHPRVMHAHGLYPAGVAAVLLGRRLGLPVVVTEHWGRLDERVAGRPLMKWLLRFTLRRASKAVAVSEFLAGELRRFDPRVRAYVVPNVVSSMFFDQPLASTRDASGGVRLIFVGSLRDDRKGIDLLLRALSICGNASPSRSLLLTVVGDGASRASTEALARDLGLSTRCRFLGWQPRTSVATEMCQSDIFVLPSRYETFGVVYAEALASGLPVIAPLDGPAPEIVPPWGGRLVASRDPQALAEAILGVTATVGTYPRARLRAHARSRFGPEAIGAALHSLYANVLAAGRAASSVS